MKISRAALIFLAFEAGKASAGFSSYLSSLSGAQSAPRPASYAPSAGTKPQAVDAGIGNYLTNLDNGVLKTQPVLGDQQQPGITYAPSAPTVLEAESKTVASSADYMSALGATSGYAKPARFAPFKGKPKVVENGPAYLSALNKAAPPQSDTSRKTEVSTSSQPAASTAASQADYLSALGNSGSSAKKASYSPFNSKPKAAEASGYLSNLNNAAPAASASSPAPTGERSTSEAPSDYMASLGGSSKMKKASYSGFSSKPKVVQESGYFANLNSAAPATSSSSHAAESSTSAAPSDYMASLGGAASSTKPASYAPFQGVKPKASQGSGYLSNLNGAAHAPSSESVPVAESSASAAPTNYMASLGGSASSATKPASYAPFQGVKPKAVQESGYFANLNTAAPSSKSAPIAESSTSAAQANYMASLGGSSGSAAKPASYAPFQGVKPKAVQESGYFANLNAAAPAASSPSPTDDASSSSTAPSNYMASLGGGANSAKAASYAPFQGVKPKAVQETGYFANLNSAAPAASSPSPDTESASPTAPSHYMASLGGGASSSKAASYAPFQGVKPKAVKESGYFANLNSEPPAASTSSSSAAESSSSAAAPANYMASLGGGASSSKAASYAPFQGIKPKAVKESGYFANLNSEPPAASTSSSSAAERSSSAAAPANYMASLGGGASSTKAASYAPFQGVKPKAVKESGYFANLNSGPPAASPSSSSAAESSSSAAAPANYMASLGGSASSSKAASYAPFQGVKPKAVQETGYFANLNTAAPAASTSSPSSSPAAESLSSDAPANYMASLGGGTSAAKPASYAPFQGVKPKAVQESGYFANLNTAAPAASTSSPTSSPAAESPSSDAPANYMASLGGSASAAKPASYAPFQGVKPKAVQESGYFANLNTATPAASSTTSSTPAAESSSPAAPANYMASLGGSASTAKPASYAPFQGVKPKAVDNGSSYLSALKSAPSSPSSDSTTSLSKASSGTSGATVPGQSFMSGLGAGSNMKRASYAPFMGGKPKAAANGSSYLSALKNTEPVVSSTASSASTPSSSNVASSGDYMTSIGNQGQMKRASYSGFNSKPLAPVDDKSYLGALHNVSPAESSYSAPAPASPRPAQSSSTAAATPKSFSPFGSKPKAVAQSGYLSGL